MRRPLFLEVHWRSLLFSTVLLTAIFLVGCASGGMSSTPPPTTPENTSVMLLITSTANDRLEDFLVGINSISLTDEKGNVVTLYTYASGGTLGLNAPAEFMHLNGVGEPLVTVSVPQATYISATVTVGYCSFTEISVGSLGGVVNSTWAEGMCGQGTGNTTVNLSRPIAVSGSAMVLALDLQVSQSYTLNGTGTSASYTISPVFNLKEAPLSAQPTNNHNGRITGIDAEITSVSQSANSFQIQTTDGISLAVSVNSSTVYQGIADFSALATGMPVNLDTDIQSDASLMAMRIEAHDTSAAVGIIGPLELPGPQPNEFTTAWLEGVGCATNTVTLFCGVIFEYDGNTVFRVSSQFSNLQNLPFTTVFSNSNMFPGQEYSVHSPGVPNQQSIETATTVVLSPQTLNGTVMGIANANGFTVYTVQLASYDLIPTLQGQAGDPYPALSDPTNLVVYADTSTAMLNSAAINLGGVVRFRGVLFNDNGTLRMDCKQINDGVAE